jgi:glycosyltransferase involved in cell wall biosynthesis
VVTQDTGFGRHLPTGKGLFAFADVDDVVDAIADIESDYDAHSRAAREIAAEYFDAETVLGSLMERAGL